MILHLSFPSHSFNPSLCHLLSPFHLSYIATSRPYRLSEFYPYVQHLYKSTQRHMHLYSAIDSSWIAGPSLKTSFSSTEKGYSYQFIVMQKTILLSFNTYLCVYSVYRYISHMDHFRRSLVKSCLKSEVNGKKYLFSVFLYNVLATWNTKSILAFLCNI